MGAPVRASDKGWPRIQDVLGNAQKERSMTEVEKLAAKIADLDVNNLVDRILITALQGAIKGLLKAKAESEKSVE